MCTKYHEVIIILENVCITNSTVSIFEKNARPYSIFNLESNYTHSQFCKWATPASRQRAIHHHPEIFFIMQLHYSLLCNDTSGGHFHIFRKFSLILVTFETTWHSSRMSYLILMVYFVSPAIWPWVNILLPICLLPFYLILFQSLTISIHLNVLTSGQSNPKLGA